MAVRRLRRQSSLNTIPSLSPALAQDPVTGDLLLCNANTGDILRCDPVLRNCTVEVDFTELLAVSPGRTSIGE